MRKIVGICLVAFILITVFSSATFAGATLNENATAENGYSVYTFGDLDFLIPDYLVLSNEASDDEINELLKDMPEEIKADKSVFIYSDNGIGVCLSLTYMCFGPYFFLINAEPSELMDASLSTHEESFGKIKNKGILENITVRGMECYLTTTSFYSGLMSKAAIIIDKENSTYYEIAYAYSDQLDNTLYTNDFYKLLYTEPQSMPASSSSDTKDAISKDSSDEYQGMHDYVDSIKDIYSGLNNLYGGNEENQEKMDDYFELLHDYVDSVQQLDNLYN